MTFYLIVPYMATLGQAMIERRSHENNTNVYLSPAMVSVRDYGSLLQTDIAECRAALTQVEMQFMTRTGILRDLMTLEQITQPAVVFEHKLADSVSIPDELFSPEYREARPLGMPIAVDQSVFPQVFYKQGRMQWWDRQKRPLRDTTRFEEHLIMTQGLACMARAVLL